MDTSRGRLFSRKSFIHLGSPVTPSSTRPTWRKASRLVIKSVVKRPGSPSPTYENLGLTQCWRGWIRRMTQFIITVAPVSPFFFKYSILPSKSLFWSRFWAFDFQLGFGIGGPSVLVGERWCLILNIKPKIFPIYNFGRQLVRDILHP